MPSAATSSSGDSKSRDHNQGNQDRKYTVEQKAAVVRVRRCSPTAFYDILGLEFIKVRVTETEIKKAYRKLSLLTHPDKNGHEHADEAFKMVSRAFGVLSDPDKKAKYDRFGGDPDSRFGGGAPPPQSPFSGRSPAGGGGGPMGGNSGWGDGEISPEEMFNRFFSGQMRGGFGPFGGGMFDTGPQIFFGIPGVRVQQFAGARPRGRPREANGAEERPQTFVSKLAGTLLVLVFFVLPVLFSLFSSPETGPSGPHVRFDSPSPPYTEKYATKNFQFDYYVNPTDIAGFTDSNWMLFDKSVEDLRIRQLRAECRYELEQRRHVVEAAQGWIFQDEVKMQVARDMEMKNCRILEQKRLPLA